MAGLQNLGSPFFDAYNKAVDTQSSALAKYASADLAQEQVGLLRENRIKDEQLKSNLSTALEDVDTSNPQTVMTAMVPELLKVGKIKEAGDAANHLMSLQQLQVQRKTQAGHLLLNFMKQNEDEYKTDGSAEGYNKRLDAFTDMFKNTFPDFYQAGVDGKDYGGPGKMDYSKYYKKKDLPETYKRSETIEVTADQPFTTNTGKVITKPGVYKLEVGSRGTHLGVVPTVDPNYAAKSSAATAEKRLAFDMNKEAQESTEKFESKFTERAMKIQEDYNKDLQSIERKSMETSDMTTEKLEYLREAAKNTSDDALYTLVKQYKKSAKKYGVSPTTEYDNYLIKQYGEKAFEGLESVSSSTPTKTPTYTPEQKDTIIKEQSKANGVPEALTKAVISAESNGNTKAVSHKGAAGAMQLMEGTAKDMKVKDRFDFGQNVAGGTKYMGLLLRKYGDEKKALAAYNWGPGNMNWLLKTYGDRWETAPELPTETRNYVKRVMTRYTKPLSQY